MDAITLLKEDHRTVKGLFRKFEQAGDRAYATKRKLADRIIRELSVHSQIEEQLFYPAVRRAVEKADDEVLEALEEHHLAKVVLSELEGMDPKDERFTPKVTVLIEGVRHHIEEEESDMFPKVRAGIDRPALRELGERMAEAKRYVPTRPHPNAPDEPPANVVAAAGAAILDRTKDVAGRVLRGNRS